MFESIGCVNCHTPPLYTSPDTFDVGMTDEQGRSFFNPPSLRGVSQRGPYFHDNRARTLRDVVYSIRHQIPAGTTDAERAALLAFLRTL